MIIAVRSVAGTTLVLMTYLYTRYTSIPGLHVYSAPCGFTMLMVLAVVFVSLVVVLFYYSIRLNYTRRHTSTPVHLEAQEQSRHTTKGMIRVCSKASSTKHIDH